MDHYKVFQIEENRRRMRMRSKSNQIGVNRDEEELTPPPRWWNPPLPPPRALLQWSREPEDVEDPPRVREVEEVVNASRVEEVVNGIRSEGMVFDASPNRSSFSVQSFQSHDDAAPMGRSSCARSKVTIHKGIDAVHFARSSRLVEWERERYITSIITRYRG